MAEQPKKREGDAGATATGPQLTAPQWQPPGAATRSMSISALPSPAELQRSSPLPQPGKGRPGSVDAPIAFDRTLASLSPVPERESEPKSLLKVGDLIGSRYVIEHAISSGAFGAVFRAKDCQIQNHEVAIKLLHKPAASDEARETALRELTLIASVSHPSVVQFKDYGWLEGRLWFAMPWYRGQTLDQSFAVDGGRAEITRAQARPIFERIARGLAAMHEVGINHHDIKPENIFLADIAGFDGGLPVLLDLGIAGKRGEGPRGLTPEYAAPEVAAAALGDREQQIGAAADVFSLALVLRNLLEPETAPEIGGEIVALLHSRASEPAPKFTRRDLRYLQPAFDRFLSRDPAERPSASELADELSILTAPEERRAARMRLLSRIVPIVLLAALVVALLFLQVRKQETQITVQREQLTAQQRQSEQLRKRQGEQLEQLSAQNQQLGTQGERLQQAIGIAKSLGGQLEASVQEAEGLRGRVRRLGDERKELQEQGTALRVERDGLQGDKQRLLGERAELIERRDALLGERDRLQAQRDGLNAQRKDLELERDKLLAQRGEVVRERDKALADAKAEKKRADTATTERDATRKAYDELRDEVKTLRDEVKDLKRERDRLKAAARRGGGNAEPTTPTPEPPAGTPPPTGAWR